MNLQNQNILPINWKTENVISFLDSIGLSIFSTIFQKNDINGKDLMSINENHLNNEFNLGTFHQKFKLLRHIEKLKLAQQLKGNIIRNNYKRLLFS